MCSWKLCPCYLTPVHFQLLLVYSGLRSFFWGKVCLWWLVIDTVVLWVIILFYEFHCISNACMLRIKIIAKCSCNNGIDFVEKWIYSKTKFFYLGKKRFEMWCMWGIPVDYLFWERFGFQVADEIQEIKYNYLKKSSS